jgi:hypothetical protein
VTPRGSFELVKWYLDVVEPDGTATIAYWTSLDWLGLNVTWHNITRYALGAPPAERSSLRGVPAPVVADQHVAWRSERLGVETIHEPSSGGATVDLLDDAKGRIVWECLAPAARARLDRDGLSTAGTGYAERMTMTVPPWELPIDELRWGRWISDDASSSVVWIDWRGALPRRWVVVNGAVQHAAVDVRDDGVDSAAGRLALGAPRTLHDRSVGKMLRGIGALARIAARVPMRWHETKWCCRATFTDAARVSRQGWTIHEIVRFS